MFEILTLKNNHVQGFKIPPKIPTLRYQKIPNPTSFQSNGNPTIQISNPKSSPEH
jgi:hypothetical protein